MIDAPPKQPKVDRANEPSPSNTLHLWVIGFILLAAASFPFIVWDDEGNPDISPERKKKLEKVLKEFDDAEQYALIVAKAGYFPCFSCKEATEIYLNVGEVYKYGVTKKGVKPRYGKSLQGTGLIYVRQFRGDITQCLKEERRKIFRYPLLPENLKRKEKLIRPPGNKRDD
ncbi:MAG: hypothetical protein AAF798_13100 [Bacteroidota bacterium]